MLLHLLGVDFPAFDGVAILAFRSELTTMDVGMTVRAARADTGKHEIGVALGAGHFLVHAAQGIRRAVVIKFRNAADGLPTCVAVTVLAGDVEGSVRISAALLVVPGLGRQLPKRRDDQEQEHEQKQYERAHKSLPTAH